MFNPIVFAEVSVGFDRVEELEEALPPEVYRRDPLPSEAAFLAGRASSLTGGAEGTASCRSPTSTCAPDATTGGCRGAGPEIGGAGDRPEDQALSVSRKCVRVVRQVLTLPGVRQRLSPHGLMTAVRADASS